LADLIALSTTFCKVAWQLQRKVRWWCYPGYWLRASVRKKEYVVENWLPWAPRYYALYYELVLIVRALIWKTGSMEPFFEIENLKFFKNRENILGCRWWCTLTVCKRINTKYFLCCAV
jgi:hypothetical protein